MLLLVLILMPQLALAKVYMCVDPVTGKATFTDKGCEAKATTEEVKVQATNVDSGSRTAAPAPRGTWVSDRDTRKTGRDYNAMGRGQKSGDPTASIDTDAGAEGS